MSFAPYMPLHFLQKGHVEGVNALAFSNCGRYLASGGDDSKLLIWDVAAGTLLQRILVNKPVLCITWHPSERCTLFFGCIDGTAVVLKDFSPDVENEGDDILTGVNAAVHAMDVQISSGWLALAIGSEVQIAKRIAQGPFATFIILPQPPQLPNFSYNCNEKRDDRIRGRSLHFLSDGPQLIVSYLNHGIVCWNLMTRERLWRIVPDHRHRHIGSSSLSPDSRTLLTYNLHDGMDLYQIGHGIAKHSYESTSHKDSNYPMPVSFLDEGRTVTCGSATGVIRLWDTSTGVAQQTLKHDGHMVRSISSHQSDEYALLATATAKTGEDTYIQIWKAPIGRKRKYRVRNFAHKLWETFIRHSQPISVEPWAFFVCGIIIFFIAQSAASTLSEVGRWFFSVIRLFGDQLWAIGSSIIELIWASLFAMWDTLRGLVAEISFLTKRQMRIYLVELLAEPVNLDLGTTAVETFTVPTGGTM